MINIIKKTRANETVRLIESIAYNKSGNFLKSHYIKQRRTLRTQKILYNRLIPIGKNQLEKLLHNINNFRLSNIDNI